MTDTDIYGVIPEGLWSQPAIDASAIAELDGVEPIQRVRLPASITYDYIPGLAPTRFLRGLAQKKILGIVDATAEEKAAAGPRALIASRTNTLLSLPMMYAMVSANLG